VAEQHVCRRLAAEEDAQRGDVVHEGAADGRDWFGEQELHNEFDNYFVQLSHLRVVRPLWKKLSKNEHPGRYRTSSFSSKSSRSFFALSKTRSQPAMEMKRFPTSARETRHCAKTIRTEGSVSVARILTLGKM
jgi:hypothetical protein